RALGDPLLYDAALGSARRAAARRETDGVAPRRARPRTRRNGRAVRARGDRLVRPRYPLRQSLPGLRRLRLGDRHIAHPLPPLAALAAPADALAPPARRRRRAAPRARGGGRAAHRMDPGILGRAAL